MSKMSEWDIELQETMRSDKNLQWFANHRALMYWVAKLAADRTDMIESDIMVSQGRLGNNVNQQENYGSTMIMIERLIKDLQS